MSQLGGEYFFDGHNVAVPHDTRVDNEKILLLGCRPTQRLQTEKGDTSSVGVWIPRA
jgi:hypothetical protein